MLVTLTYFNTTQPEEPCINLGSGSYVTNKTSEDGVREEVKGLLIYNTAPGLMNLNCPVMNLHIIIECEKFTTLYTPEMRLM